MSSRGVVPGRHASIVAVYDWLQFHLWILPVFLLAGALLVAYEWELLLDGLVERRLGA